MDSPYTVRTVNLWKVYRTGAVEYAALKNITISIPKGEFVGVVGPSGSGKTTLLTLIGTLGVPTKGEIFLDGISVSKLRGNQLASIRNKKIGFVFQSYNLVPYLKVIENVELPLVASDVPQARRKEEAKELLEKVGMINNAEKKPNELSGGEQQRVAIARALVNDPPLILADEPTGNLDSKSAEEVVLTLRRMNEERDATVILVTHNMEITKHCDRIVYLKDGTVEKEQVISR